MQILAISRHAFERVRERMAEIQDFTQAGFTLIERNDSRLLSDRPLNDEVERGRIAAKELIHLLLQKLEQLCVANDAVFNDFINARAKFARRKGPQQFWIRDHEFRRVERTDEILPFRKIYSGL